jgi:hypothetical protein
MDADSKLLAEQYFNNIKNRKNLNEAVLAAPIIIEILAALGISGGIAEFFNRTFSSDSVKNTYDPLQAQAEDLKKIAQFKNELENISELDEQSFNKAKEISNYVVNVALTSKIPEINKLGQLLSQANKLANSVNPTTDENTALSLQQQLDNIGNQVETLINTAISKQVKLKDSNSLGAQNALINQIRAEMARNKSRRQGAKQQQQVKPSSTPGGFDPNDPRQREELRRLQLQNKKLEAESNAADARASGDTFRAKGEELKLQQIRKDLTHKKVQNWFSTAGSVGKFLFSWVGLIVVVIIGVLGIVAYNAFMSKMSKIPIIGGFFKSDEESDDNDGELAF